MATDTSLFIVVESAISPLRRRIEGLVRGSKATIQGFGLRVPPTLARIAATTPTICIIEASGTEEPLLAFTRGVHRESPTTRILFMSEELDALAMARSAVSGVWNHLPLAVNHQEFAEAITAAAAGRQPDPRTAFGKAAALVPASPKAARGGHGRLGRVDKLNIDRCLAFALPVEEIARHLRLEVERVRRHVASGEAGRRSWFGASVGEVTALVEVVAILGIAWMVSHLWLTSKAPPPFRCHPVSGRILYEDGEPIPADGITLTFVSVSPHPDPRVRPRPGLALVEPHSGRFGWVTSLSHGDGMVEGLNKVLVTGRDFLPLPDGVMSPDYVDPATTPLEVTSPVRSLELRVRRPPVAVADSPGGPADEPSEQ